MVTNKEGTFMRERVLAIYPHPDDKKIGKAGRFINHVKNGDKVTLICATMGQVGGKHLVRQIVSMRK